MRSPAATARGEMEAWLDEHGVENAWEVAPTLVSLGYEQG